MMAPEWQVDDPSIPDTGHVYRRFNIKNDTVIDLTSGCKVPHCRAFLYDNDGMSVSVSTAMSAQKLSSHELVDWAVHGLVKIPIASIRRQAIGATYVDKTPPVGTVAIGEHLETPGGVILNEVVTEKDPRVGKSHGLVRIEQQPPAKSMWKAFRNKIMLAAEFKPEQKAEWKVAFPAPEDRSERSGRSSPE